MTKKPLQASLDALNDSAEKELARNLANRSQGAAVTAPAGSAAAQAGAGAGAAAAGKAVKPVPAQPAGGWTADQRVYLDCMEDQARKYAGVDESASDIADVAISRCRDYLGSGGGTAALQQEGRMLVMGAVLDAKAGPAAQQPRP